MTLADEIDRAVRDGRYHNLHAVILRQGGETIVERYYRGNDARRGEPLGVVDFGPDMLHDLRSVSKSIVGLLYGIALDAGRVPAPDAVLVDQFTAYTDLAANPERRRMTVHHALTMSLGTEWDESAPYTGPWNSEIAMEMADDMLRYILDRPYAQAPGTGWTYNGGATHLLGHLIERGSGRDLLDYARQALFDPLGLGPAHWDGPDGQAAAASGLRLTPRDLATIGQMILDGGRWGGRQIVPADWLAQSRRPQVSIDDEFDYGYQFWLARFLGPDRPWVAAHGNGGQRLIVLPHANLVFVCTCGNYDRPDQSAIPISLMRDMIVPALG